MWQNSLNRYEELEFKARLSFLFIFLSILFFLLISRLFYLQVIKHTYFRFISDKNRIYTETIKAPRGEILSNDGKVLVGNRGGFTVVLGQAGFNSEIVEKLATYMDIDSERILAEIERRKSENFADIVVCRDIPEELMWNLTEHLIELKGVKIIEEHVREYNHGNTSSHLFGYISEVTAEEFKKLKKQGYSLGDYIGKIGLEKFYENSLKGIDGFIQIETDAHGHKLRIVDEKKAKRGSDLQTTIDADLQKLAEELSADSKGAIVVLDAKTAAVRALVSSPGYDSNQFLYNINAEKVLNFNNQDFPMLNRAIQATYPPASIFKIITTVAALEEKIIKPEDIVNCTGGIYVGKEQRYAKCWKKEGHGRLNLLEAFKNSCDVYYYHIGTTLGYDKLYKYAKMFGVGQKTQIDLPYEVSGFLPTKQWKKKKIGYGWYEGDTVNMSIGQGFLLVTPLGLANMLVTLVNDGKLLKPFLVERLMNNGQEIWRHKQEFVEKLNISDKTINFMLQAMSETVTEGTGRLAFLTDFDVCGKTGTAQNPHGEDHAWFVGFAPKNNPEIVICVLAENGGGGGGVAAPIAGRLFKEYFLRERKS